MKTTLMKLMLAAMLLASPFFSAHAQGLLGKLGKSLTKSSASTETTAEADTTATDSSAIDWDAIPIYHPQLITETDAEGNPVLNADGTPKTRVLFVDQFGRYRSQEAVEAQRKKLKKYVGNIVLKVGGGAAAGAVSGLLAGGRNKGTKAAIGAGAGAVAGALLSLGDIKRAKEINKSLKEQDKMMEAYRKNFTNEGVPTDASANIESIEGLNIDKDAAVSKTADEIKQMVESEEFNTPEAGIWDSI